MRVFNTPFNSPLNNTGDTRTETRTRTEVSSGGVKDVPGRGGGRVFDCKNLKYAEADLDRWYNSLQRNFQFGARDKNPKTRWPQEGSDEAKALRAQGFKGSIWRKEQFEKHSFQNIATSKEGWVNEDNFKRFNSDRAKFMERMASKDFCGAAAAFRRMKTNLQKGRPEEYYYSKISEYGGDEERLRRFKEENKNLLTTITEQRQITDSMKENLPGYLKTWEDNKDGVRSKYKSYEDYVIAAEKWKKDNPGWNKEEGGSTTPWIETSRKTERIERT